MPTHTRLRTRRIPVVMYVAALLLLPGLVVVGFMSAGLWATTGSSASAQAGKASGAGTGPAAPADPADVKGSMTVQQVVDAFPPLTAAQLLEKLGAPLDTPTSTQLKTLAESGNAIEMTGVRTWLEEQGAG